MKTTVLVLTLSFLSALTTLAAPARSAERANIQAILVAASNERGATDRRLAPYEPNLRRILRFESYRFLGEGSAALAIPAQGDIALGNGHRLELATEKSDEKTVRVRVQWTEGGRLLMNTVLVLRPGVPAILGGPTRGDKGEVYAVIVIAK
jgi:hypothetical protein